MLPKYKVILISIKC